MTTHSIRLTVSPEAALAHIRANTATVNDTGAAFRRDQDTERGFMLLRGVSDARNPYYSAARVTVEADGDGTLLRIAPAGTIMPVRDRVKMGLGLAFVVVKFAVGMHEEDLWFDLALLAFVLLLGGVLLAYMLRPRPGHFDELVAYLRATVASLMEREQLEAYMRSLHARRAGGRPDEPVGSNAGFVQSSA